jgi:hypothetical protein
MIVLTADELDELGHLVLKKIDKDKRFDRYTDLEIVTILGVSIMIVGANVALADSEEQEEEEALEDGGMAS